jgi:hypothetical protein
MISIATSLAKRQWRQAAQRGADLFKTRDHERDNRRFAGPQLERGWADLFGNQRRQRFQTGLR